METKAAPIHQAHDSVFRAALSDIRVAQEFLMCYLPEHLRSSVDFNTLKLQPESYIDSQLKRSQSDVLYEAQVNSEQGYVYLLLEHFSQSKPLIPFTVHKYNTRIWEAYLKQNPHAQKIPLIVNLVFYTGKAPFKGNTDFKDLFNAPKELVDAVWGKPLTLIDVHTVSDEILHTHTRAGILTFFMRHIWARDFLPHLKQVMHKLKALEQMGDTDFVLSLLHYALGKGETGDVNAFIDIVKQGLSDRAGEEIMTMAQQLLERGKQYGIEQGIKQGMQQGEYSLLLHLIEHKFHQEVPETYRKKMAEADAKTLLKWGKRVLDAKDLDDVFVDRG